MAEDLCCHGAKHDDPGHVCACNPLVPQLCRVIRITEETPDVKTFRVETLDGKRPFTPLPGQLGMYSLLGVGEAMFSITAFGDTWIESAIKRVGKLTEALHQIVEGQIIGLRGPYGNHFPVDEAKGKNLLIIGGGIGLAPVRSFFRYVMEHRDDYGAVDILYGSRTYDDLVFKEDLFENWPKVRNTRVHVTVDRGSPNWNGNVGFIPPYLEECAFSAVNCVAVICGPPVMINLSMASLVKMGFSGESIYSSLEMKMQCGIGKCGRCNVGSKYVCLDGPVFTKAELDRMPSEH